jgi:predicted DNA-binding protein (UPF0251 family)
MNKLQTGGDSKTWLFSPQDLDTLTPILQKLVTYDEYFIQDSGQTTLQIVLDTILDELPTQLEEAVRLVYLAGLSYRSAGRTIGVDHKTVKARADKGIDKLKKRLNDTVWLASLINGMLPENIDTPKVSSPEKIFNVLKNMESIGSNHER